MQINRDRNKMTLPKNGGRMERKDYKPQESLLTDGYMLLLSSWWGWFHSYRHLSIIGKPYPLNMCSLLHES